MFENPFQVEMLVDHPAFGVGRVIAIQGDRIHVFFHGQEKRSATKLTLESAKKLLRIASAQTHEWLDHLPPFEWEPRDGVYVMKSELLTHKQAIATFLQIFPGGFEDPRYIGNMKQGERAYKQARNDEWRKSFGAGEGRRLLAANELPELTRRLLHIAGINLLHPISDKTPLKDALAEPTTTRRFFQALLDAAENEPSQERFESLGAALDALPRRGLAVANWPVTTIFPWLADPARHMLLRTKPTLEAAKRLAFELNYKPQPNWRTYKCLLVFADLLLKELREYKAKDFMDVQSFIFVTGKGNYEDPAPAEPT